MAKTWCSVWRGTKGSLGDDLSAWGCWMRSGGYNHRRAHILGGRQGLRCVRQLQIGQGRRCSGNCTRIAQSLMMSQGNSWRWQESVSQYLIGSSGSGRNSPGRRLANIPPRKPRDRIGRGRGASLANLVPGNQIGVGGGREASSLCLAGQRSQSTPPLLPLIIFTSPDIQNMLHCPPEKKRGMDWRFPKGVWGEKHGLPSARHTKPASLKTKKDQLVPNAQAKHPDVMRYILPNWLFCRVAGY